MIDLPGNTPAPTFDLPLDMLRACHTRIMLLCSTLNKLLHHLPAHGCDSQARQAARAVLLYFDTSGHYHHQDEEMDLFPLLLATPSDDAHEVVMRLLGEHHEMDAAWLRLRARLHDIAEGHSATLEESVVANFSKAYERHIAFENSQLLPIAARLLSPQQLHELGKRMAARRGVSLTQPDFATLI